jgi:predicted DNA-binding transcriptional regulator AlpA
MRFMTYDELHAMGLAPSRQHTRLLVAQEKFPRPVRLGTGPKGHIAWREDEVEAWIAAKSLERFNASSTPEPSKHPNERRP